MIPNSQLISPVAGDRKVSWLHILPNGWKCEPLKYLVKINVYTLDDNTDELLRIKYIDISSVNANGEITHLEEYEFGEAPSRARRIVHKDDVLISTVRTYLRAIAYSNQEIENLICSTGFAVLTSGEEVIPKFLFYWSRASFFVDEIVSRSTGVSYPAINASEIGNLPFPLINKAEQSAIAGFLDRKTDEIDRLVELKERQIKILDRKRQAIITHAVTCGLNLDAPLRPLSIYGFRQIPVTWNVISVRHLIQRQELEIQDGNHGELHPTANEYVDEGIPFLMANNIRNGKINFENCNCITEERASKLRIGFAKPKDVLLTHKGTLGETAVVPDSIETDFLMLSPQVTYYRLQRSNILPSYLYYFFCSRTFQDQMDIIASVQSTRGYVGLLAQKEFRLLIPPIEEQEEIVNYLDVEVGKLELVVQSIQTQIARLRDYKQALISAAVTGRIDVRRAAT